jgi:hypothetical protein
MPVKTPKTENPSTPPLPRSSAAAAPTAIGTAAVQAWMDMGTETVRFLWDRLQQDIETQQAMLACTSLEEMRKVQAEFFATAQEQYTAEAVKMLAMMGKATASGLTASAKARRYDDVPL